MSDASDLAAPHLSTAAVAEIGALLGDPGRANMLLALMDGRARTARELADQAGVAPQTASSHLAKLAAAGLIGVQAQGRHRYHRLASAEVAHLLEVMQVAGASLGRRSASPALGPRNAELRAARTCYDHLAGRLAVQLADALVAADCVRLDGEAGLTAAGTALLEGWGAQIPRPGSRRAFCRACLDWSERRPHIAGAVGAAILDRSLALDWVRRRDGSRALSVTPAGQQGFARVFGVAV